MSTDLPLPTEAEINAAIQTLLRAKVLREFSQTVSVDLMATEYYREHALHDARRNVAAELAKICVESAGDWQKGYGSCVRRIHGWVLSYVDVQRALSEKRRTNRDRSELRFVYQPVDCRYQLERFRHDASLIDGGAWERVPAIGGPMATEGSKS